MYIAVINFCANLNVYKYVCNDVGVVYNVEVYCSPSFQVLIVLVTHKSLLKMMTSSDTKYSERDSNPQPSVSKTDALTLSHPSTFQMPNQCHAYYYIYHNKNITTFINNLVRLLWFRKQVTASPSSLSITLWSTSRNTPSMKISMSQWHQYGMDQIFQILKEYCNDISWHCKLQSQLHYSLHSIAMSFWN